MRVDAPPRRRVAGSPFLHGVIVCILSLLALLMIYPVYNVLLVSVTPFKDQTTTNILLFPRSIDLSAYRAMFVKGEVPHSLLVSAVISVIGVMYNMVLSVSMAYALSRKGYWGRSFFTFLVVIPMFFSGGLIPFYLTVQSLGLRDSILSLILPTGINVFYMFLVKNYMNTIPLSLEESAKLDGANDIVILCRIFLPVTKPILATVFLYYIVDRWNDYFLAILFIRSAEKMPIQMVLRNLVVVMENVGFQGQMMASMKAIMPESLKMAVVVVSFIPIMIVYPFLQKHFTKGIILGSIKA